MSEHDETPVIACTDLHKSYAEGSLRVAVLHGVNLAVGRNEGVAIMGASGSGKSTLLHLLGGLELADRGTITLAGQAIATQSDTERGCLRNQLLGFIYQFHHLLPEFTAIENVAMPLLFSADCRVTSAIERARDLLCQVGLEHRLHHKPGELSGGERQRAAIARALVNRPQCILADEPTGNLDEQTAERVFDLIVKLKQTTGTSIVIVTHNKNLAEKMDRIYTLHNGCLMT